MSDENNKNFINENDILNLFESKGITENKILELKELFNEMSDDTISKDENWWILALMKYSKNPFVLSQIIKNIPELTEKITDAVVYLAYTSPTTEPVLTLLNKMENPHDTELNLLLSRKFSSTQIEENEKVVFDIYKDKISQKSIGADYLMLSKSEIDNPNVILFNDNVLDYIFRELKDDKELFNLALFTTSDNEKVSEMISEGILTEKQKAIICNNPFLSPSIRNEAFQDGASLQDIKIFTKYASSQFINSLNDEVFGAKSKNFKVLNNNSFFDKFVYMIRNSFVDTEQFNEFLFNLLTETVSNSAIVRNTNITKLFEAVLSKEEFDQRIIQNIANKNSELGLFAATHQKNLTGEFYSEQIREYHNKEMSSVANELTRETYLDFINACYRNGRFKQFENLNNKYDTGGEISILFKEPHNPSDITITQNLSLLFDEEVANILAKSPYTKSDTLDYILDNINIKDDVYGLGENRIKDLVLLNKAIRTVTETFAITSAKNQMHRFFECALSGLSLYTDNIFPYAYEVEQINKITDLFETMHKQHVNVETDISKRVSHFHDLINKRNDEWCAVYRANNFCDVGDSGEITLFFEKLNNQTVDEFCEHLKTFPEKALKQISDLIKKEQFRLIENDLFVFFKTQKNYYNIQNTISNTIKENLNRSDNRDAEKTKGENHER